MLQMLMKEAYLEKKKDINDNVQVDKKTNYAQIFYTIDSDDSKYCNWTTI